MWHTTSTPSAIRPAAMKPHSCDTRLTAVTKPLTFLPPAWPLLDRERLVDQPLAVGHFLGELRERARLRDLEPRVELRRSHGHDLDLVLLERLDHLVVEALRLLGEVFLRLPPRLDEHVLLGLGEAREGLLRHQHRLVHEPQRVVARRRKALHLLVDAERDEAARAG